ncbi:MAG: L,D-transpeptidase family protein [Thermotogota bacterium]
MKNMFVFILSLLLLTTLFSIDIQIKESIYYPEKKIKEYNLMISEDKIESIKVFLMNNALRKQIEIEKNFQGNYSFKIPYDKYVGELNLLVKVEYDNKKFSKFFPKIINVNNYKTETKMSIIPLKGENELDFMVDIETSKNVDLKQIKVNGKYFDNISDLKKYMKKLDDGTYLLDFQYKSDSGSVFSRDMKFLKIGDFVLSDNSIKPQERIEEIKYYVVKKGDSIYKIAEKYGVTPGDILNLNDLKEPSRIYIGQVLKIGTIKYGQSVLRLEIDLSNNFLYLYYDDLLIKKYLVAVGRSDSTPPGYYRIYYKEKEPPLYWGDEIIYSGSIINGIGSRWIQLSEPKYGIHGTTKPWEIGKMISHGCIRMFNFNVEELDFIASLGTEVYVYRDQEEKAMLKNEVEDE